MKFSQRLAYRMRCRKRARDLEHPKGYKGAVMWCSACRGEIMRIPVTRIASLEEQRRAVDEHAKVCERKPDGVQTG